jgi:hypothetical protein
MLDGDEERQLDRLPTDHRRIWFRVGGRGRLQQAVRVRLEPRELHRRGTTRWIRGSRLARTRLPGITVEEVQTGIRGNPVEPGTEGRPALKGLAFAPSPQKCLLDQIFRLLERAEHPIAMDLKFPPIQLDQLRERRLVARQPGRTDHTVFTTRFTQRAVLHTVHERLPGGGIHRARFGADPGFRLILDSGDGSCRVAFITVGQSIGLSLAEIGVALEGLPTDRAPTKRDWERGWAQAPDTCSAISRSRNDPRRAPSVTYRPAMRRPPLVWWSQPPTCPAARSWSWTRAS